MTKAIYYTLLLAFTCITACDRDFLNVTPNDKIDAETFFNTETDLNVYTNGFYDMLPTVEVYTDDAASDNIVQLNPSERVRGSRIVPVMRGSGGWSFSDLRSINYFLQKYERCPDENAKLKYGGIARFFRACFYFDKVKTFGDVPFYNKVLTSNDPDLYKPRDPRKLVIDSVLADINFAVANIPRQVSLHTITGYTALALKARICLFEGTFRKYHGLGDYQSLLAEAAVAADELISSNAYRLYTTGDINTAYHDLFARNNQDPTETILARDFDFSLQRHNIAYLMTSPTQGAYGITKDLINSYLMRDGSRFTDLPDYQTKEYYEEMQDRDPRLIQTTAGPDFSAYGQTTPEPVNLNITTTGYRVIKALPTRDQWVGTTSYNDIILFRYAESLLIYAEAKAELGTLTQADLDKSVNKLRERVGMPHMNMADANANPDPFLQAMYPNADNGANNGIILEIRRERRIELFNEGLRWDDLMRWKEGKKMLQPFLGIYFPSLGSFDFNNDGKTDVYLHTGDASGAPTGTSSIININQKALTNGTSGNIYPLKNISITFDEEKDYLAPIPIEEISLNPDLEQNPHW